MQQTQDGYEYMTFDLRKPKRDVEIGSKVAPEDMEKPEPEIG